MTLFWFFGYKSRTKPKKLKIFAFPECLYMSWPGTRGISKSLENFGDQIPCLTPTRRLKFFLPSFTNLCSTYWTVFSLKHDSSTVFLVFSAQLSALKHFDLIVMFFSANIIQFCNQNVWDYQQVSIFYFFCCMQQGVTRTFFRNCISAANLYSSIRAFDWFSYKSLLWSQRPEN